MCALGEMTGKLCRIDLMNGVLHQLIEKICEYFNLQLILGGVVGRIVDPREEKDIQVGALTGKQSNTRLHWAPTGTV